MMSFCDNRHSQIVYMGDVCPACEIDDRLIEFQEEMYAMIDDRQSLLEEINKLKLLKRKQDEHKST